ncbi:MAG: AsmA family protein, partial [Pseudomonadota bacterium]
MASFIKFIASAIAALVVLAVVAIVLVALLFDPNDYRDQIAAELSEATGREVRLEGDLSLKLFPWLAVETAGVSMAAAPAFGPEPMLRIDSASAAVRVAPLLRGAVEIGYVTVQGLALNLAVRGDGLTSWSDLVENLAADDTADTVTPDAGDGNDVQLSFLGVIVEDASISYVDAQAGSEYVLSNAGIQIDGGSDGAPIGLKAGLDYALSPNDIAGTLTLALVASLEDGLRIEDIVAEGNVAMPALSGSQPFALTADRVVLDDANNTLNLEGGVFEFGAIEGALTLAGSGPSAPVDLSGRLSLQPFSSEQVFAMLATDAPQTTNQDALQRLALEADLLLNFESATLGNLKLNVDQTTLTGTLGIADFTRQAIRFDLTGDSINLDDYLPPADADAEVAADGGDNLAETALPVDLIRGLNAQGNLRFARLTLGDLPFEDLNLGLNVASDRARLRPISATVLNGKYDGDVQIDASGSTPSLSLNESISGLDLGALAALLWERDNVEGTLAGNFKLGGRGETLADIRQTLAGNVQFELSDGALAGTDLWYQLRRARAVFKQETPPEAPSPARTEFSNISGSAVVADGVARNDDFQAQLPF